LGHKVFNSKINFISLANLFAHKGFNIFLYMHYYLCNSIHQHFISNRCFCVRHKVLDVGNHLILWHGVLIGYKSQVCYVVPMRPMKLPRNFMMKALSCRTAMPPKMKNLWSMLIQLCPLGTQPLHCLTQKNSWYWDPWNV